MTRMRIPVFPLHSVLFPGGPLPLRIFEPRYLDMISRCLREGCGFGICLIEEGREVGGIAKVYEVGTLGEISYWHERDDGLLGITFKGLQRFRILDTWEEAGPLLMAEVELLEEAMDCGVDERFEPLVTMLKNIFEHLGHPYILLPRDYGSAHWVSARLSELAPLSLERKQALLVIDDPLQRLEQLLELLTRHCE